MRVKKVTIEDDGDYLIGALSMDQVESIVGPVTEAGSGRTKILTIVSMSLNNAIRKNEPGIDDNDPRLWDADRVRKTFDLVTMPIIKDEVLKFSNLRQEVQEEVGEAPAAQAEQ